jgi:hypothetical protein
VVTAKGRGGDSRRSIASRGGIVSGVIPDARAPARLRLLASTGASRPAEALAKAGDSISLTVVMDCGPGADAPSRNDGPPDVSGSGFVASIVRDRGRRAGFALGHRAGFAPSRRRIRARDPSTRRTRLPPAAARDPDMPRVAARAQEMAASGARRCRAASCFRPRSPAPRSPPPVCR